MEIINQVLFAFKNNLHCDKLWQDWFGFADSSCLLKTLNIKCTISVTFRSLKSAILILNQRTAVRAHIVLLPVQVPRHLENPVTRPYCGWHRAIAGASLNEPPRRTRIFPQFSDDHF